VQPKAQSFYDNAPQPGGAVSATVSTAIFPHGELFLGAGAKSQGWVVTKASLDAAFDARLGINLVL
jgi:hypothetical protein